MGGAKAAHLLAEPQLAHLRNPQRHPGGPRGHRQHFRCSASGLSKAETLRRARERDQASGGGGKGSLFGDASCEDEAWQQRWHALLRKGTRGCEAQCRWLGRSWTRTLPSRSRRRAGGSSSPSSSSTLPISRCAPPMRTSRAQQKRQLETLLIDPTRVSHSAQALKCPARARPTAVEVERDTSRSPELR